MSLSVLVISCDADDYLDDGDDKNMGTINLNIDNLMQLESNEMYEGWIIVDGTPISTGTFSVNAEGGLSKSKFSVDKDDLEAATDFVLSIEPNPDHNAAPSAIKILGGGFSGMSADISAAHGAALGNDFADVAGKFILATLTTTTTDDELSGI